MKEKGTIELAFLGDAEFTRFVRYRLVCAHDYKAGELTRQSNKLVSAVFQAEMLAGIADRLTEEESDVARRARNAHTPSHAKNAGLADYKRATALEAIFGYLALKGDRERLDELMAECYRLGKIRLDGAK